MGSYFLDTYILIKWAEGSESHRRYVEEAREGFRYFERYIEQIDFEDIALGSKIKWQHYKKKLSYADCLSYAMALNRKMRFLTGDPEFEHFENVEFAP